MQSAVTSIFHQRQYTVDIPVNRIPTNPSQKTEPIIHAQAKSPQAKEEPGHHGGSSQKKEQDANGKHTAFVDISHP